jgi:hypothetical protein
MEIVMKTIIQITIVSALATGFMALSPTAHATDTSTAIQLCSANPNCRMSWDKKYNTITMEVGTKVIECPKQNGPCSVIAHLLNNDPFNTNQGRNGGSFVSSNEPAANPPGGPSFY